VSEPEKVTYEQAREQLAEIVATLEAGDTTLEAALGLWERGEQLAAACVEWLDGAQQRLDSAESDEEAQADDEDAPTDEEAPSD